MPLQQSNENKQMEADSSNHSDKNKSSKETEDTLESVTINRFVFKSCRCCDVR